MRETDASISISGIATELAQIGQKEGFDVFVQTPNKLIKNRFEILGDKNILKFPNESRWCWTQDNLTFTPDGYIMGTNSTKPKDTILEKVFNRTVKSLDYHLAGGNFFFLREGNTNSLLIGKNSLNWINPEKLRKDFGVNKIYPISQPDFHIDLGVRPLSGKNILVNDDELAVSLISQAISKANQILQSEPNHSLKGVKDALKSILEMFQQGRKELPQYGNFKQIQQELGNYGFNVIKVPGSLAYSDLAKDSDSHYMLNYMNAIVHERPDGRLVYMTNKSYLDELTMITKDEERLLGFSFEKMFTDSVKDYIAPEDIHFITGNSYLEQTLEHSQGGLHCLCAEEPR